MDDTTSSMLSRGSSLLVGMQQISHLLLSLVLQPLSGGDDGCCADDVRLNDLGGGDKEQEARGVVAAGKVPFSDLVLSSDASTAAESAAESAAAPNTSCITTGPSYPSPEVESKFFDAGPNRLPTLDPDC